MAQTIGKNSNRVIGVKQVSKAIKRGAVASVYVADDAEQRVLGPLMELCAEQGIELVHIATMKELGKTCEIEVGAAAAAILKGNAAMEA